MNLKYKQTQARKLSCNENNLCFYSKLVLCRKRKTCVVSSKYHKNLEVIFLKEHHKIGLSEIILISFFFKKRRQGIGIKRNRDGITKTTPSYLFYFIYYVYLTDIEYIW